MQCRSIYRGCGLRFVVPVLFMAIAACSKPGEGGKVPGGSAGADGPDAGSGVTLAVVRREGIPETGIELGYGWNTRRSETVPNHCIEFTAVRDTSQVVTLDMSEVSDQSEIMEHLKVNAKVSVKTMFASGSAKSSFARDSKVSSSSTNLLLNASVENGVLFVGPPDGDIPYRTAFPSGAPASRVETNSGRPGKDGARPDTVRLKPWARRMVEGGKLDEFRSHCGDSFVSAIYSGGQVLATISFSASSKDEREALKVAVKGSYGAVHGAGSASTDTQTKLSNTRMDVHFMQVGGGRGSLPIDRESLMKKLEELPAEVSDSPVFNEMEVTSYETLPDWSGPPLGGRDASVDTVVSDYYWFLTSFYRDIQDVMDNPGDYVDCSGRQAEELEALHDTVFDLRRMLLTAMHARSKGRYPDTALGVEPTVFFAETTLNAPATEPQTVEYRLDLSELEAAKTRLTPPDYRTWYQDLAGQLQQAVPLGIPNTLRLLLPLPNTAYCENDNAGKCGALTKAEQCKKEGATDYPEAVVQWYLGRQSRRMCERDPLDPECLGREQLSELAAFVPWSGK